VLDTHLDKPASDLRMLGFDMLNRNGYPDEKLTRRMLTHTVAIRAACSLTPAW